MPDMSTKVRIRSPRLPQYGSALMGALQFAEPEFEPLRELSGSDWDKLLAICDSTQVTLLLSHLCNGSLPGGIHNRISRNARDNAVRFDKMKSALSEISERFAAKSIDHCLLKG